MKRKAKACPECGAPTLRRSGLHRYCERHKAKRKAERAELFAGVLPRSVPALAWTDDNPFPWTADRMDPDAEA